MKVIHEVVESCNNCPYGHQDEEGAFCTKADPAQKIFDNKEKFSLQQKYGSEFPPFCPLPDLSKKT